MPGKTRSVSLAFDTFASQSTAVTGINDFYPASFASQVVARSDEDEFLLASLDKAPLPESRLDKERAKFFTTLARDKYPPPPILPQISQFFNEYQEMPNRAPLEQTHEELMRDLRYSACQASAMRQYALPSCRAQIKLAAMNVALQRLSNACVLQTLRLLL